MHQKNSIKKILTNVIFRNEISVLVRRLLILYLIIAITQVVFYFYNQNIVESSSLREIFRLIQGAFIFNTISILYINSLFIVLSTIPFRFRIHAVYQKILFWLYTITNAIAIVMLNLGDAIYFPYARKRFTFEEIHFVKTKNTFSIVLETIISNFWIVLIAIFLIAGMVYCYKKIKYHALQIQKPVLYYSTHTLLFFIVIFLTLGGMRGGFHPKLHPYNLCNASHYTQTPIEANLILSNPFCVLKTVQISKLENPNFFNNADELASLYTPYHYPNKEGACDLGERNIMIFILESFSKEHSKYYCPDIYPDHPGFTPFLDSLMQEGYVFTNAFSNGIRSIEALPSILTSIPSYQKPFVMLPQSLGEMEGLPKILNKKGYTTSFFCGTEKNSMFFQAFTSMAGIQKFYAREDYEKECPVNKNTIEPLWGVYDMPFYQYMATKMAQIPQPFLVSVFNLTSHHPYTLPSDYVDKMPKGFTLVQPCVAYTDLAIRKLFERIEKEPWFQNTIFVFIADHVSPEIYAQQTRNSKGRSAIFYFIYTPDKSIQGTNAHVTQQLDVMPTLLGLIGYKKPYFAFGRDVLNETERFPMASNYINEVYQCITDSIALYFNGETVVAAYATDDVYQKHNTADQNTENQQKTLLQLKALLQSYFNHVNDKKYIVPDAP